MKGSIFTDVNMTKPSSNTFDLSHERKTSMSFGKLTPILCQETLPGDKFSIKSSHLLRLPPLIAPIMHSINVYTHFFFCPNRLIWEGWQKFITGGEQGDDTTAHPYIDVNLMDLPLGGMADMLGIPAQENNADVTINPLPFGAATKIFNDYYRDQNLQDSPYDPPTNFKIEDGNNNANVVLEFIVKGECGPRAWQHDYFTSCLPSPQKGPEATIPLGTQAQIVYQPNDASTEVKLNDGGQIPVGTQSLDETKIGPFSGTVSAGLQGRSLDISGQHYTDLSTATAAGIVDLRRAFKLQEWLEKNARGGSRYIESIKSHFGVNSSDARLQRAEYIGGSSTPLTISEVLQTSNNDTQETPQGNMAGHGLAAGANRPVKYFCEEHGFIIGFMSIMPKTGYQQGLPKMFSRFDKFDYAWPSFAHIGEQPVQNKELYVHTDPEHNEATFGYIPRYAPYKYTPSTVHGAFRTTLDMWHMGRKFDSPPMLNEEFIQCRPTDRIFAVLGTEEQAYVHIHNSIKANRKLPYFANPRL